MTDNFLDGEPDVESMHFQSELQSLTNLRRAIAVGDWETFEAQCAIAIAFFDYERAGKLINILMDNFLTESQQGLLKQYINRSEFSHPTL